MENAQRITDEMILQWESMVYNVYYRTFVHKYKYLKEDLLQCGRLGVFLALRDYEIKAKDKCNLTVYVWLHVRGYMTHYIKHEKNHILYDLTKEYNFAKVESEPKISNILKLDVDRALNTLSPKDQFQVVQWANDVEFKDMGFKTRQNSHKHFKVTLKRLKEKFNGYEP